MLFESTLTPCQKNLIHWLKSIGMNNETTVGIMALLGSKEKQKQMADFLLAEYDKGNKHPTEQEILRELKRILEK